MSGQMIVSTDLYEAAEVSQMHAIALDLSRLSEVRRSYQLADQAQERQADGPGA